MNKWTNDTINQQLYVKLNDIIFFLINGLYFDKHTQPHRFKCDLYVNNAKVFISMSDHPIELWAFVSSFEISKGMSKMSLKVNIAKRELTSCVPYPFFTKVFYTPVTVYCCIT